MNVGKTGRDSGVILSSEEGTEDPNGQQTVIRNITDNEGQNIQHSCETNDTAQTGDDPAPQF